MSTFNTPIQGATTVIAELELRNNPDLPVVDTTKVRGGAHYVNTLQERDMIPVALRKQGTTRVYVGQEEKFYFLPYGIQNEHWRLESVGYGLLTAPLQGKSTVIANLDTEGFQPGIYRVEAHATGVFPVGGNNSGPAGALARGTLLAMYANTADTWVVTQIYLPATDLGAASTLIKNVYTRSREMHDPDRNSSTFTGTPWRMIPYSDNIMSAVLQSVTFQAQPSTAFSFTYPHTNITAANPPFTISQVLSNPWITATLNSSNVTLTGTTPAYGTAESKNNAVLMKLRDSLGVETVFSLTVQLAEPGAPQYDGSANIDVSFPETADYNLRLQCVTPGTTVTDLSMKPGTSGLRYLRPANSMEVDPANLYGLAIKGKVNTDNAQIKNYRFGLNLAKIRTDYPALASIKFDLYAGLKSGFDVDLFLITLNRALGGGLVNDPDSVGPLDWLVTGIDSNPGGTSYPPNPNHSNMFIAGANDPAERKVATLEYFLSTNVWQIDYLAQVTLTGSLWNEASGFKVSNLANNGQYDFPSLFDFYFDVKGLHDEVLGTVTRPDGQTHTWGPIPVNSGQALNSGYYQAKADGSEARQYGSYSISFKTRYKGVEKGVLNMNVISKAPNVPATYTIETHLRNETVQPNTTVPLVSGQEYDLPALFDVGWQVTGPHTHVRGSVTRPGVSSEVFTWGPEAINDGNVAQSGYYQMAGPGLSETRRYGNYSYNIQLFNGNVDLPVASITTAFTSNEPAGNPSVSPDNPGVEELVVLGKKYITLGSRDCSLVIKSTGNVQLVAPATMQSLDGSSTCTRFVYYNHRRLDAGQLTELLSSDGLMPDPGQNTIAVHYYNTSQVPDYDFAVRTNPHPVQPFAQANAGYVQYLTLSVTDAS